MAWADDVENAHATFLSTWGIAATWRPRDKDQANSITGVIKNPGIEEELRPGGVDGTVHLRFWVDSNALSLQFGFVPSNGDVLQVQGVNYDVRSVDVDIDGGSVLKLRKT